MGRRRRRAARGGLRARRGGVRACARAPMREGAHKQVLTASNTHQRYRLSDDTPQGLGAQGHRRKLRLTRGETVGAALESIHAEFASLPTSKRASSLGLRVMARTPAGLLFVRDEVLLPSELGCVIRQPSSEMSFHDLSVAGAEGHNGVLLGLWPIETLDGDGGEAATAALAVTSATAATSRVSIDQCS
eukprot:gene1044-biopygen6057